jgi:hypothetical protein
MTRPHTVSREEYEARAGVHRDEAWRLRARLTTVLRDYAQAVHEMAAAALPFPIGQEFLTEDGRRYRVMKYVIDPPYSDDTDDRFLAKYVVTRLTETGRRDPAGPLGETVPHRDTHTPIHTAP